MSMSVTNSAPRILLFVFEMNRVSWLGRLLLKFPYTRAEIERFKAIVVARHRVDFEIHHGVRSADRCRPIY